MPQGDTQQTIQDASMSTGSPVTPPTFGPMPTGGANPDAQTQELLRRVLSQKSQLPMPPPAKPGGANFDTKRATTHAEGNQLFFHNLGALIGTAVQDHKEKQVQKATATMQTLNSAWQDAQDLANGDPDKAKQAFSQMPQVKQILTDPKQIKELAKLMSFDAMDPEKNKTVYHEAAARVGAANKVQEKMKGIRQLLGLHREQLTQQNMKSPEALTQELTGRAQKAPVDVKGATEVMDAEARLKVADADLTRAQAAAKEKYQISPDKDNNLIAVNKYDPTDVVRIVTPDGKAVTAATKAGSKPTVVKVGDVPYGIARDGKILTPDSKEWTAEDATAFNASKAASATNEANKQKLAERRETFFSSLPQAVLMKQDDPAKGVKAGELAFVTRKEAGTNPAKYAPVAATDKAMGPQARFGEIQATVDMTNTAIANLPDTGFDAKARAQLAYVMRAPDPASALDAFFKSGAATTLTDAQVDYVTSLVSMVESAQAMTSLQGIGARGSDKLRATITAMLPGAATPSRKYAETQMKKFQVELDKLRQGVATAGGATPGAPGPGGPTGTTSFTDAGVTYDIPRDKVAAFKRAHPNATTAR